MNMSDEHAFRYQVTWHQDTRLLVRHIKMGKSCLFLSLILGSAAGTLIKEVLFPLRNSYILLGRDSAQLEFEAEASSTTRVEWV